MKYKIVFHSQAKKDLLETDSWYADISDNLVVSFNQELETVLTLIQKNPKISPIIYKNKHKATLKKFPFSIIYGVVENEIRIYSVFHH